MTLPRILLYYYVFGVAHEIAHVISASLLVRAPLDLALKSLWQCFLPSRWTNLAGLVHPHIDGEENVREDLLNVIRHSGWIVSFLLALFVTFGRSRTGKECSLIVQAAWITAIEAFTTDFIQFKVHGISSSTGFLCGNFGVILIPPSSREQAAHLGQKALDLLERMITITMMRGAQTGGVVAWAWQDDHRTDNGGKRIPAPKQASRKQLHGIRSRVVNSKRTDLSKVLCSKVKRDAFKVSGAFGSLLGGNQCGGDSKELKEGICGFFGHTRFATSSKATLDATHPHQWTPPRWRRIYPLNDNLLWNSVPSTFGPDKVSKRRPKDVPNFRPVSVRVENFITHNGDLDGFEMHGQRFDVKTVQTWLEKVTGVPMPTTVDSAAIAGLVDVMRTAGCFALSLRYALVMAMPQATMQGAAKKDFPSFKVYERFSTVFEDAIETYCRQEERTLSAIKSSPLWRKEVVEEVVSKLILVSRSTEFGTNSDSSSIGNEEADQDESRDPEDPFSRSSNVTPIPQSFWERSIDVFRDDDIEEEEDIENNVHTPKLKSMSPSGGRDRHWWTMLAAATIDAFFDNDLLRTTTLLLKKARGSFGLMVTSSMDGNDQVCLAARGQTMSIAFYPRLGVICYGSELAAVKAGMNLDFSTDEHSHGCNTDLDASVRFDASVRLDLDDFGGEVCLIDWRKQVRARKSRVVRHDANTTTHALMGGKVQVTLTHLTKATGTNLSNRVTYLEGNDFIQPLPDLKGDLVKTDIKDIPQICHAIQSSWRKPSLNRLTAYNLVRCVKKRLQARVDGKVSAQNDRHCDILVTGCEVSLWLAEQFASDLKKAFPGLFIKAVSSNKLLGVFGQELSVPAVGHPVSEATSDLHDTVVIIVSHSGGTFAPLACSNLLQSFTESIFVVTSEWDTQIGKQLRTIDSGKDETRKKSIFSSRIFSTEVGLRPAEPSSVSVAGTHQLLTQIFEMVCTAILMNPDFCHLTDANITKNDLQILERCNRENICSLANTVGADEKCDNVNPSTIAETEKELRSVGDLWSEHILENARAYVMTFLYVIFTVTFGYPLVTGIAVASGLRSDWGLHITRLCDAFIYFFLPQINILILRIVQGRNLRHRMVGRTVVIGDVPWVSQAAEAFLSKLFACSYSIAGLNVISGNPADHLVHRHTHRVVRGTLLVCGRPDGRLAALTSAEAAVCLSVNQASSIQSLGGTCESVTIGHNPTKLSLTEKDIFITDHRPKFLCEQIFSEEQIDERVEVSDKPSRKSRRSGHFASVVRKGGRQKEEEKAPSIHALMSSYARINCDSLEVTEHDDQVSKLVTDMIAERQRRLKLRSIFNHIDKSGRGAIGIGSLTDAFVAAGNKSPRQAARRLFDEANIPENDTMNFDQFAKLEMEPETESLCDLNVLGSEVDDEDLTDMLRIQPYEHNYFGADVRQMESSISGTQNLAMELYESRIASLQRFVAMTVMFHQMGHRVQRFFEFWSFGLFQYRIDRTQSIMRIATTASPVSGADIRERMEMLRLRKEVLSSIDTIWRAWLCYKLSKESMDICQTCHGRSEKGKKE